MAELKKQANVQASIDTINEGIESMLNHPINVVKEVLLLVKNAFVNVADPNKAVEWDMEPHKHFMVVKYNDDKIKVIDWLNDKYIYLVTKQDLKVETLNIAIIARRATKANCEHLEQDKNKALTKIDFGALDDQYLALKWLWE